MMPKQKYKIIWYDFEVTCKRIDDSVYVQLETMTLHYYFIILPYMDFKYYQPIFKAKQSMETRAINKLLQRILGDPYFQW
jgi:hypothetical protein